MNARESKKTSFPTFDLEASAFAEGFDVIAGIDEAGRGPWAGPVVAAAVVLDAANIPVGLNDSKKLHAVKRDELFDEITASAEVGIGIADVALIDDRNILWATMWAMADGMRRLNVKPALALIDGNRAPKIDCPARTVVKGDGISLSIAAASIIAKVTRDRMMVELDSTFPGYDFARHKGYGTAIHQDALARLGPCPAHRRSFAPIRAMLDTPPALTISGN
ncbi:MAG: ribonuclease HII [Rhizobiales bacterium]|nr:ribonuclease HII [Hyphomicrobiales bacterium]